jgi:hypothetical protein
MIQIATALPGRAEYVPNFQGDFKARATIAQADGQVQTFDVPLPADLATTKQVFDQTWQARGADICDDIKASVNFSEWHFCTPATDTELQVEPAGKNRFRIRYLARQTKLSFDATQDFVPVGEWFDPTIDISFDLMVEEQIYVAEDFALSSASSVLPGPVYIPPARFSFSNASVTSEHIASGLGDLLGIPHFMSLLGQMRDRLNRMNGDMPFAFTEGQRDQLEDLIFGIAKLLPRPGEGANDRFALDMSIEDNSFRLHFRRDQQIPAGPSDCTVESSSCHVVIFACGSLPSNSWAEIRSYPESWLYSAPTFYDEAARRIGVMFSGEATYTYRVCAGNSFGKNCTPSMEVTTVLSGCGSGPGDGGSVELPRCPTGQSPCAGGQCKPIAQCEFPQ